MQLYKKFLFIIILLSSLNLRANNELHIAVTSSFKPTLKSLAKQFKRKYPVTKIIISSGSTGKLYAQIINSAPYDIFLAADTKRPKLLDENEISIKGSRKDYALGQLALFMPGNKKIMSLAQAMNSNFTHFAIANPKLAPYGESAKQFLKKTKKWQEYESKLVRGENVSHTFSHIWSSNSQLGLVALSQLITNPKFVKNQHYWKVPNNLSPAIKQQMVLLTNKDIVKKFYNFMNSKMAKKTIQYMGYVLPVEVSLK